LKYGLALYLFRRIHFKVNYGSLYNIKLDWIAAVSFRKHAVVLEIITNINTGHSGRFRQFEQFDQFDFFLISISSLCSANISCLLQSWFWVHIFLVATLEDLCLFAPNLHVSSMQQCWISIENLQIFVKVAYCAFTVFC